MAGVRAGGTVTISEAQSTTPTTPLMSRIHRYINVCNPMGPPGTFWDPSLFYNTEEFTLDHNEQHLLLLEVSSTSFSGLGPFFKIDYSCRDQLSTRASLPSSLPS